MTPTHDKASAWVYHLVLGASLLLNLLLAGLMVFETRPSEVVRVLNARTVEIEANIEALREMVMDMDADLNEHFLAEKPSR